MCRFVFSACRGKPQGLIGFVLMTMMGRKSSGGGDDETANPLEISPPSGNRAISVSSQRTSYGNNSSGGNVSGTLGAINCLGHKLAFATGALRERSGVEDIKNPLYLNSAEEPSLWL